MNKEVPRSMGNYLRGYACFSDTKVPDKTYNPLLEIGSDLLPRNPAEYVPSR